jgi:tetratricopeptide (TPR) repeat protein
MPTPPDPFLPYLNRAEALFRNGDVVPAGQIWQAILKRNPGHAAARAGLLRVKAFLDQRNLATGSDARREPGPPALDVPPPARPDVPTAPTSEPRPAPGPAEDPWGRAAQLVQEGAQIYDLGMAEEAVAKWREALELNPQHLEAQAYLAMAQRDLGRDRPIRQPPPTAAPAPPPVIALAPPPAGPDPDPAAAHREAQILRAEQALGEGRVEEALRAFQRLMEQDPQEPRILHGFRQSRSILATRDVHAQAQAASTPVRILAAPPVSGPAPAPVDPPRALTVRGAAPRDGIHLPRQLKGYPKPGILGTPRRVAVAGALGICAVAGLLAYGWHRREQALREAVAAAKVDALKPVSRMVQVPNLAEANESIRQEGEQALASDPLLAYFRAQELQRRDPDDALAAKLLQQAKDQMAALVPSGSLAGDLSGYDKALQGGNLEEARRIILELLDHDPDNPDLRDRARKVLLALAPLYAAQDSLARTRGVLVLGRAMFPQDPTWRARLKLLEAIQAMSASERGPWISLLG